MASMSVEEKEALADRIVAVLKDSNPAAKIADLKKQIDAGDEGEDGMNSVVAAVAIAMLERVVRT